MGHQRAIVRDFDSDLVEQLPHSGIIFFLGERGCGSPAVRGTLACRRAVRSSRLFSGALRAGDKRRQPQPSPS
jgi:hypothetical protein